jgi:nucleotide-binding universal stress UspA family protein
MYKTILVPLDGSKRAEAILPHVEGMAHRFEAKVVLLQVVESHSVVVSPIPEPIELNLEGLRQHLKEADAYLASLQGKFLDKKIKARRYVEHGPIVETIINVAAREGADLIAMASHGRSGLSRVFYGSVAAGVLQKVDRPLLLIRSRRNGRGA